LGKRNITYHHGEHWIRGLKTVGTFFPEIPVLLQRGDVASNAVSGLSHDDVGFGVFSGEGLGDAEAADASADDYAVDGGGVSGFGRRCGGFLGNGATNNRVTVRGREFSRG